MNFTKFEFDFGESNIRVNDAGAFRTYERNGIIAPSITSVLGETGDKTGLEQWKERVGHDVAAEISKTSTTIGNELHRLCEDYVDGKSVETKDFKAKSMFNNVKRQLDKNLTGFYGQEVPLFSEKYKIAGRTDLLGRWLHTNAIIDYKSNHKDGKKADEHILDYKLQLAGYSLMLEDYGLEMNLGILLISSLYGCQVVTVDIPKYKDQFLKRREEFYKKFGI